MNMYPQMETPGGTCTPKQKYEWACWDLEEIQTHPSFNSCSYYMQE